MNNWQEVNGEWINMDRIKFIFVTYENGSYAIKCKFIDGIESQLLFDQVFPSERMAKTYLNDFMKNAKMES